MKNILKYIKVKQNKKINIVREKAINFLVIATK